jgi:hypothetical protein
VVLHAARGTARARWASPLGPQAQLARERISPRASGGRCEICAADYREVDDGPRQGRQRRMCRHVGGA